MTFAKTVHSIQSLVLLLAVVLSGVHAKDALRSQATVKSNSHHVALQSDDGMNKISTDPHNHVDKQTLKMFYHSNATQHYADRRTLEILEHSARSLKTELKVGFTLWWRLAAAKLFF